MVSFVLCIVSVFYFIDFHFDLYYFPPAYFVPLFRLFTLEAEGTDLRFFFFSNPGIWCLPLVSVLCASHAFVYGVLLKALSSKQISVSFLIFLLTHRSVLFIFKWFGIFQMAFCS